MSRRFSMGPDEGKRVQRSVYYASNSDPSEARYMHRMQATYTWMFVEDMSHIIPPRANDENYREKVSITPNIRDLVCRISNGFDSFNDGYHRDIAYPLSEFLRLLMGELCFDGVARFEIARLFEPGKGTPTAFKLAHLNPFQLRMTDGQLVQVVPPDTAKQYGVATEIPLPRGGHCYLSASTPLAAANCRGMRIPESDKLRGFHQFVHAGQRQWASVCVLRSQSCHAGGDCGSHCVDWVERTRGVL